MIYSARAFAGECVIVRTARFAGGDVSFEVGDFGFEGKDAADAGQIGSLEIKPGSEGYPPDLDTLVDGVAVANDATGRKLKFLRKVPIDPMTHGTDWGLRSYQDKPDSTTWGGQNVFDVYTTFNGTALDGTKYRDW